MDPEKLFRGYKYFQEFVYKYEYLPNSDELIIFYYNRYVEANKCKTLPFLIEIWTKNTIEQYRPHFEKMEIKEILRILEEFRSIDKRVIE